MVPLPEYLKTFRTKAEQMVAQGLVRDIEFSGSTYQVQVIDPKTKSEAWAFLQLDNRGQLADSFCSCEKGEEFNYCVHIAAAFLRIYNSQKKPLHLRFRASLWNQLCQLFANQLGDDPSKLKKIGPGNYQKALLSGKILFSIRGKNREGKEYLEGILEHRRPETEETSLKFSNLPQDEIMRWREGRPSDQLRYELSYWNDIAHWLMQLQERHQPYKIKFDYSPSKLPSTIKIAFADLEVSFNISETNLPIVIPALATVNSPLTVHTTPEENIEKITYDKKKGLLKIVTKEPTTPSKNQKNNGESINGWVYVYGDGFYPKNQDQLLTEGEFSEEHLEHVLTEHSLLVQKFLVGAQLHVDPIALSYSLHFDSDWNLHIVAYVFEPGDLSTPYARFFGHWIYIDDHGFYPIENPYFSGIETIIPAGEVPDFVVQERSWLNLHEGFQIHLAHVEAQVGYTVDEHNLLRFFRSSAIKKRVESRDFGPWVYIQGEGFYAKESIGTSLPLQQEIAISSDQIPLFIRANRSELALVPKFFSERTPVAKGGLQITLTEKEHIRVTPHYEYYPDYVEKEIRIFDEFVYVAGEGFSELPANTRLPERYRRPVELDSDHISAFLSDELMYLQKYAIATDPRLFRPASLQLVSNYIAKEESKGATGYLLKLYYQTDRGEIPLAHILKAIKGKKRFLFSEAGCIDLHEKRFEWLKLLPPKRLDGRSNILHLSTLELIRLHALDPIQVTSDAGESGNVLRELTEFHVAEVPNLSGFLSELRNYQNLGVLWLWFLYRHGLSGLLCDEMGLGKTHQGMGLIEAIINHCKAAGQTTPHFLVVCPTSVIYHWQDKLAEFLPHLRVCVFHGSERSLESFHQQYDILLTSYGIWRLEYEMLKNIKFELAILDEIQIAKNHRSRLHFSLRHMNAMMRLGLTGTPIENQLSEMKSLFDLVLPGYMPGEADYREIFVRPIERENNPESRRLLTRFIKPFILRRKKNDVLIDLPEKVEEISRCDLSPEQLTLYNDALMRSKRQILDQLQDSQVPIPYVHIFALLSSLKQICNHPASFLKVPEDYKKHTSGKWDLFVELLSEARESQQKVVVFSQYLTMLDIFEEYFNEIGVEYASIRGSTVRRGEEVERFNTNPKCEVFLGSLRAAGLGIDLTGGSVVIHYDRWWNAAREDQATDRVHRIGQTRGVQVFKLVTSGSFEERIDALITKKSLLMEEIVLSDDHRFIKAFNRNELIQLLQEVEEVR